MTTWTRRHSCMFTLYRTCREATNGKRLEMDGAELEHNIASADTHHGPKQTLRLICPATFKDDHRGNDRVERVYMLGLDIDKGQPDPDLHIARLSSVLGGAEVFAYSTLSSTPGAYRLRALIPYDRPATGDEHRACWAVTSRMLGRANIVVDRACSDPARGFYVWAIPENEVYWKRRFPGAPLPVALAVDVEREHQEAEARAWQREAETRAEGFRGRKTWTRSAKITAARNYIAAMPPAILGTNGSGAAWKVAWRLVVFFELGDADALGLFSEYNARCKPPWSLKEILHKLSDAKKARLRVVAEDR